jgi:predicted CopG family antitoxin
MSDKTHQTLKQIAVSEENYLILKGLGHAGDSFNDVISEVLKPYRRKIEAKI